MSWFRLEDRAKSHPKIVRVGPAAAWLWASAGMYCAEHLTDGFVPAEAIGMLGPFPDVQALARRLLDERLLDAAAGGYRVHDYLDYNPSAAEARALSAQRAEAGSKGGKARAVARAVANAKHPVKQTASKTQAVSVSVSVSDPVSVSVPSEQASSAPETSADVVEGSPSKGSKPKRTGHETWLTPYLDAYLSALNVRRRTSEVGPDLTLAAVATKADVAALAAFLKVKGPPPVEAWRARVDEWTADEWQAAKGLLRLRDFPGWYQRRILASKARPAADNDLGARW